MLVERFSLVWNMFRAERIIALARQHDKFPDSRGDMRFEFIGTERKNSLGRESCGRVETRRNVWKFDIPRSFACLLGWISSKLLNGIWPTTHIVQICLIRHFIALIFAGIFSFFLYFPRAGTFPTNIKLFESTNVLHWNIIWKWLPMVKSSFSIIFWIRNYFLAHFFLLRNMDWILAQVSERNWMINDFVVGIRDFRTDLRCARFLSLSRTIQSAWALSILCA